MFNPVARCVQNLLQGGLEMMAELVSVVVLGLADSTWFAAIGSAGGVSRPVSSWVWPLSEGRAGALCGVRITTGPYWGLPAQCVCRWGWAGAH